MEGILIIAGVFVGLYLLDLFVDGLLDAIFNILGRVWALIRGPKGDQGPDPD